MSYRGEDLDLRTQPVWGGSGKDLASDAESLAAQRGLTRNGPMWVDDTVLACANHAFDVALAHRAGEVRLEHFLHAMTRIDAAAEALEARGVRVAALRRESATIIASEIPVGLGNGKGAPRRSDEVAEVLRMAASAALRRNAPASIDDVLNALFDPRTEIPALGLLARHTMRSSMRETLEQFPPLSRYPGEVRYVVPPSDRYVRVAPEPVRYVTETPRMYRPEMSGTATDAIQNSRIEALEQMVRNLSDDLASERQLVSSMLKDLTRDTQAQRDDQGRLHTGLYERMQDLERVVTEHRGVPSGDGLAEQLLNLEVMIEQRLKDVGQGWSSLSGRITDLEATLRHSGGDANVAGPLGHIAQRLDAIEGALLQQDTSVARETADRLRSLEGQISDALAGRSASTEKIETLLAGFGGQSTDFTAPIVEAQNSAVAALSERLTAVEQALTAEIETAAAKHNAYAQDLGEVHEALLKLNQNQHTLAGSIDQWRGDAAGDIAMISNRLAGLDREADEPIALMRQLSVHIDRLNRVMVERYHRRNRFWYWLFGTDDWLGASWPSQVAAIEKDEKQLKTEDAA